ncbi:MAG: DUF6935 domain-containing protein [Promethearchaeota archaeon]
MKLDEFKEKYEADGKTPEGAIRLLLVAALETVKEKNPDGKAMWSVVLPKNKAPERFAIEQFSKKIKGTDFPGATAASYLGGTPENKYAKYKYDAALKVTEKREMTSPKDLKVWVKSGGKDNPSPVRVKQNKDGYWKIFEYSSLYTMCKSAEDPDDF